MIYQDRVYGKIEIEEPVILELIASKPLQRLKGISQYGIPDEFYHLVGFSRFEHSVGVMLLLKKFNATLEEQVAGLLHDVSHTTFSHVVDWVFGDNEKEDYQDKAHQDFILKSRIVDILAKYNLDSSKLSVIDNFKLLEQEIPDLCADRLDYTLRDTLWENPPAIQTVLENLINFNNNIVFTDLKIAESFAKNYSKCQREHWGGYEAVGRYYYFSRILKEALAKNIISPADFYQDEEHIISKIYNSQDNNLINTLDNLRKKTLEKIEEGPKTILKKKFRFVDPKILQNEKLLTLSTISPEFNKFLEKQRLINSQGFEF